MHFYVDPVVIGRRIWRKESEVYFDNVMVTETVNRSRLVGSRLKNLFEGKAAAAKAKAAKRETIRTIASKRLS
jgi:hypothetical protein